MIAVAVIVAFGACRDEPNVVIDSAREALKQKDFEGFERLLTPRSADLLRRADEVGKRSGRAFKVLRAGRPTTSILPKGELGEPIIDGNLCTVLAKKGNERVPVILRLVRGQWRIDLLEMQTLLTEMTPMEP